MSKLRIVSEDGSAHRTRVLDENGEMIEGVTNIIIWTNLKDDEVRAQITLSQVGVDAEIKKENAKIVP